MLVNIGIFFIECVKLLFVLCGMLNYKIKKSVSAMAVLFLCVGVLVVKGITDNGYRISTSYFVVTIVCALMIEGKRRFLFSVISYLGIYSLDEIIQLVRRVILIILNEEMENNLIFYLITNVISLVILGFIVCLLQKLCYKRNRKIRLEVQNSSRFYLLLFLFAQLWASLCMISVKFVTFNWNVKTECLIMLSVSAFSVIVLLLGILLIYNNNAKRHYKRVAEINRRFVESQERYYQMLLEKESETRMFRHDITNHIMCVDALLEEGEYKEAKKYLRELKSFIKNLKVKQQTGNRLVNVIVNDVSTRYRCVNLIWRGELPSQMNISNMDVCVIFSNILENAFSAASECEEKQEVEVDIKGVANGLVILVRNNMVKPVIEKNGKFITYKLDERNHGIGTLNVKNCVRLNGGDVGYSYTEKNFITEIVLPNVV